MTARATAGRSRHASVAVAASLAAIAFVSCLAGRAHGQASDVPYVPTPPNVVTAMLDIAKTGPDDFVIDLGSGDGRIVIAAAKQYGARGFGVDLDGALVSQARREAERQGVQGRVEFFTRNIFVTDIDRATVLTSYLFPRVNLDLRPRLFSELKPGTRVVSHEFDYGNWKPDAHVRVPVPNKPYGPPSSDVYLWIVPANAAGRWQWKLAGDAPVECEAVLEQTFQMLRGSGRAAGASARVENARLAGEAISFVFVAQTGGREVRHELSGRISGDTIRGKARASGAAETEWQATRVARGTIDIDAAGVSAPAVARNF
jgi:hypothetical protein